MLFFKEDRGGKRHSRNTQRERVVVQTVQAGIQMESRLRVKERRNEAGEAGACYGREGSVAT